MRYRLLGRSGLRVSEVALGAMTFSDRGLTWGAGPEGSRAIFDAFAEAGGTFVDTANIYGDNPGGEQHSSERVLGDLLAADRDHFVLATKYTSSNTFDVSRSGNSLKSMRDSVDGSLRALRTDHIDLLWLHTWDATTPVDEVLRGANQLVSAGKILYFGFSDTPAWVVSHAAAMADARGWTPPIAIQVEYSLAQRTPERDLVPMAEALDLGIAAWSPLAGGRLTGKYVGARPAAATHRLADAFTELEAPGGGAARRRRERRPGGRGRGRPAARARRARVAAAARGDPDPRGQAPGADPREPRLPRPAPRTGAARAARRGRRADARVPARRPGHRHGPLVLDVGALRPAGRPPGANLITPPGRHCA